MSDLIVEVCRIDEVLEHPNAERLDICVIKGWRCVVGKDELLQGDKVVYIPPDTQLPEYVARQLGVFKYMKGTDEKRRIGQIRLRGEPSFGVVIKIAPEWVEKNPWEVGKDVIGFFGATKYMPPILDRNKEQQMAENPLFPKYTNIENMRHYPDAFNDTEPVVVTEKIHGTNCRIGMIEDEWVAGSHRLQRRRPTYPPPTLLERLMFWKKAPERPMPELNSFYWFPYTMESVRNLVTYLREKYKVVVLFGETYGRVQSLRYGLPQGLAFRAFDLYVDGSYMDFYDFKQLCEHYGVPMVPIVAEVPYSIDTIKELSEGQSLVEGADHIREGVVVKPAQGEISSDKMLGKRLILKYVSDTYLLGDAHQADTTDE